MDDLIVKNGYAHEDAKCYENSRLELLRKKGAQTDFKSISKQAYNDFIAGYESRNNEVLRLREALTDLINNWDSDPKTMFEWGEVMENSISKAKELLTKTENKTKWDK